VGKGTAISWATDTFNTHWGCEHASRDDPEGLDVDPAATSPECDSCYAETFDHRVGGAHWGPGAEPRWFGDAYWAKLRRWNAEAEQAGMRRRVFVSSMADWAQRHRDPAINAKLDAVRARLWGEILACPALDFLLLTKRAERLAQLLPWADSNASGQRWWRDPWPNVWVGVTCGVRSSLWRIARLREIPAVVRFVSGEPLLEHITAEDWDAVLRREALVSDGVRYAVTIPNPVHWLIIGDESHQDPRKRRPAQPDWVRTAREAAARHGVTFHLKQLHEGNRKVHLPVFDGRVHNGIPRCAP